MFGFDDLLTGGLSFVGGLMGNQSRQQSASAQMDFQQNMSNTAYQRATADMKAAGLNPMLAYSQGPASTPGGASADMSDVISPAVGTAQTSFRLKQEVENMKAQEDQTKSVTDVNKAQERNIDVDTRLKEAQIPATQQSVVHSQASVGQIQAHVANLEKQNSRIDAEIANLVATTPKIRAEVAQIVADTKYIGAAEALARVNARLSDAHISLSKAETLQLKSLLGVKVDLAGAELALTRNRIPESEAIKNYFESAYGKASPYIDSVVGNVGSFAGSALGGALGAAVGGRGAAAAGSVGVGKITSRMKK